MVDGAIKSHGKVDVLVNNAGVVVLKPIEESTVEDFDFVYNVNIKGVFQVWMRDGTYREIPLKECHAWTREGCNHCPDFAAEHADISCGGIGENADWTLTIVRTDLGREIMSRMIADGTLESRPGDSDPGAIALMRRLAENSRARWPTSAAPEVRLGLPTKK